MAGLVRFSSCREENVVDNNLPNTAKNLGSVGWLKKIGMIGFMFFLAKGLLWLAIPLVLVLAGYEH